jgi:hypothetical protein
VVGLWIGRRKKHARPPEGAPNPAG